MAVAGRAGRWTLWAVNRECDYLDIGMARWETRAMCVWWWRDGDVDVDVEVEVEVKVDYSWHDFLGIEESS